jgi:hypothetical protein
VADESTGGATPPNQRAHDRPLDAAWYSALTQMGKWSERRDSNHGEKIPYLVKLLILTALQKPCLAMITKSGWIIRNSLAISQLAME